MGLRDNGRLLVCAALTALCLDAAPTTAATVRLAVSAVDVNRGAPFERYIGGSIKSALFDGLTQISLAGVVSPALALSWRAENDTTWIFNLRPDVRFHDGAPLTAATIEALFAHLGSPAAAATWMAQQMKGISARAVDATTVAFTTAQPDPLLPRRLSMLNVVDMATVGRVGARGFADRPVGTGPYRLTSWGPNATNIKLTAVPGAWRPHAGAEAVEMRVITDGTRRAQALMSGEVDIAINLEPDLLTAVRDAGFEAIVTPNPIVIAIGFRTVGNDASPLTDARVRRALNHAVDRTAIAEQILQGLMRPASQGATPGTVGYNAALAPYRYDPGAARALLAEAGYPEGFAMTLGVWTGQIPGDAVIFQKVAQDLAAVGIRAELRVLPFPDFNRRLLSGDWGEIDAFSINWSSRAMLDAGPAFEMFSCTLVQSPFFCDPALDQAFAAAAREMDGPARTRTLEAAMAAAAAAAPSLFLVDFAELAAVRRGIGGYEVRSDGVMLERLTVAPP